MTRADVARKAGVSSTTVAYVMNPPPGVKIREATKIKVLAAAKALGYSTNFSARSMKRGKTELVGILTPEPASQFHPFYAQMLQGIYDAAAESDYHFLSLSMDRRDKTKRCLRENYVDGVIVIQSDGHLDSLQDVLDQQLPVVTLNFQHDLPVPQISMDYEAAMRQAVDELQGQGAGKILFVHGSWESQPVERYRSVFSGKAQPGVKMETLGIERYALEPEQISRLLAQGWGGLIVDGYELAREIAYHADYRKKRKRPPLAVFSESLHPAPLGASVTILQSQPQRSGQLAWQELLNLLNGKATRETGHSIPFLTRTPEI
mgnify:CR=1 FL=1